MVGCVVGGPRVVGGRAAVEPGAEVGQALCQSGISRNTDAGCLVRPCRATVSVMADQSMWKLGGLSIKELGRRVWAEIADDEVTERAAALSYYFLFALFPALLFLVAMLGFLPLAGLQERLIAYAREVLP